MSYWIGLSPQKQMEYDQRFREPALKHKTLNSFKIQRCKFCDQIIVMKLIEDALSNSSGLIYAGECVNKHWNQEIPCVPYDVKNIPRCPKCHSYSQWSMSKEYNGWFCLVHGAIPLSQL